MYTESANSYIKMTNELSDLRSAMLLEQAAYCYLQVLLLLVLYFYLNCIVYTIYFEYIDKYNQESITEASY